MNKTEVSWNEVMEAVSDIEKYDLDFVDALALQTMKKNNVKEIYTNNKDFNRVKGIRRGKPTNSNTPL